MREKIFESEEMKLYKFYIIGVLVVNMVVMGVVLAHASDCQDPSKLSPKMKKAYYQLKKAEKEAGFKVSIKCSPVQAVKKVKK